MLLCLTERKLDNYESALNVIKYAVYISRNAIDEVEQTMLMHLRQQLKHMRYA